MDKISLILIAASSHLLAIPECLKELRNWCSQFRVEFVRSSESMGKVVYSGPGAVLLRERLELSRGNQITDFSASIELCECLRELGFVLQDHTIKFKMTNNCFRFAKIIEVIDLSSKKLDLLLALHGFDRKIPQSLVCEIINYALDKLPCDLSFIRASEIIDAANICSRDVWIFSFSLLLSMFYFCIEAVFIPQAVKQFEWMFYWAMDPFQVNFLQSSCCFGVVFAQAYVIFKPINWVVRRLSCETNRFNPSWRFLLMYWFYNRRLGRGSMINIVEFRTRIDH